MGEADRESGPAQERIRVLWLTPDKPTDISVGRTRIAERLREKDMAVTLRGTTPSTLVESLRERTEYDVVVGTTRAGAFAGGVLKLLGTPLVIDHVDPIRQFEAQHSWPAGLAVGLGENASFRLADHVLYVYEEERARVGRYARAATETDLGVAYDRFSDPGPELIEDARERLGAEGIESHERVVIYVGGLEPIYHIEELLVAMEHVADWTLVVLGAGQLDSQVERAARTHENVVFLGTVSHEAVPGYLHAADVGICLVDDPHTLKVLEYAAAGLSVVQARGRAEARFGEYVEFCEPVSADIARAVRAAGQREPDSGFRAFAHEFDYERVAETYARVIRAVTGDE